eukprot:12562356-Alexandrium_andersonii.AAC.1
MVAFTCYIKAAAAFAATFEAASRPYSAFLRTTAKHRESVDAQVPTRRVPRKPDEEGPTYLARCLTLCSEA